MLHYTVWYTASYTIYMSIYNKHLMPWTGWNQPCQPCFLTVSVQVIVKQDTRFYVHLPSDRMQIVHPMIRQRGEFAMGNSRNRWKIMSSHMVARLLAALRFWLQCTKERLTFCYFMNDVLGLCDGEKFNQHMFHPFFMLSVSCHSPREDVIA